YALQGVLRKNSGETLWGKAAPETVVFAEHGVRYEVLERHGCSRKAKLRHGHKTGFFLDQRPNRKRLRELAEGKDVLDLFSYTGGFALAAAMQGAATWAVDQAPKAMEECRRNFALNGLDAKVCRSFDQASDAKHALFVEDCWDFLRRAADEKKLFDIVVLDPPSMAPRASARPQALKAYGTLNQGALRVLRPGGRLISCSCSSHITRKDLLNAVEAAARQSGCQLQLEEEGRPAADHPVRKSFPEGDYLQALLPPGKKICFDFAGGNCAHGDSCHWYHAEERELREARRLLRQIQCKHGANCLVGHCVFGHAAEARHSDWRDWNNWSGTQQVPSGTEGSESETDLSQIETDGSSTSASNSEASPSCADAEASATRQQFLQTKLAPVLIFQGPGICVVSKPAGWSATAHGCSEDQGQPLGLKDLLCSGCVEPLSRHPASPVGHWKAFLSPSALTSGPAILVQTGHARRRLARAFTTGRVVTYSLALVEGKLDPERSFAACRREDGMLEVLGIAGFQRVSKETWGGEASCQSYTLVLVKAAGSALGGERRLLQLAWGTAAVGDVDFGARTEQCFGGRPFFHCLATLLADPWWWADTTYPAIMVCPFPDDLRSALSQLDVSEPLALQEGKPRDEKAEKLLASATSIGAAVKEALVKRGLLPAELTESLGVPATCGVEAERRPPPDPTPYGMDRWEKPRWEQDVPRSRWIVSFLQQAVAGAEEFQVPIQADGWVFALDILGRFPQLAEACWSNVHILSRLLAKDPIRSLEVKVVRNRVAMRRVSAMDRLQAFVEAYVSGLPPETKLPVAELLCNEHVKRLFNGVELPDNPEKSLLRCLRPCALFDPEPKASHLTLRPARERLRLGLEGLLASPEGGLHQKIEQGQGSVSLSWLLRHFGKQLLGSVRLTPQQVREALSRSEELEFDCLSFTVPGAKMASACGAGKGPGCQKPSECQSSEQDHAGALQFVQVFPEAKSWHVLLLDPGRKEAIVSRPQVSTQQLLSELRRWLQLKAHFFVRPHLSTVAMMDLDNFKGSLDRVLKLQPRVVVETSHKCFQVWLTLDDRPSSKDAATATNAFGADMRSAKVSQVGRLPGPVNWKPGKEYYKLLTVTKAREHEKAKEEFSKTQWQQPLRPGAPALALPSEHVKSYQAMLAQQSCPVWAWDIDFKSATLQAVQNIMLRFFAGHELPVVTWTDNGGQFRNVYNRILDAAHGGQRQRLLSAVVAPSGAVSAQLRDGRVKRFTVQQVSQGFVEVVDDESGATCWKHESNPKAMPRLSFQCIAAKTDGACLFRALNMGLQALSGVAPAGLDDNKEQSLELRKGILLHMRTCNERSGPAGKDILKAQVLVEMQEDLLRQEEHQGHFSWDAYFEYMSKPHTYGTWVHAQAFGTVRGVDLEVYSLDNGETKLRRAEDGTIYANTLI
ncbi:unnamed protein product, partial [Effrenium voratum]